MGAQKYSIKVYIWQYLSSKIIFFENSGTCGHSTCLSTQVIHLFSWLTTPLLTTVHIGTHNTVHTVQYQAKY